MIAGARYGHTNLIARDWKKLAAFYTDLFGCTLVPPERDYAGADLERGTGVPGSTLKGVHLRLPGHGAEGPTLEIYSYSVSAEALTPAVNRPGFGHICFIVDSVPEAHAAILAAGGRSVAGVVTLSPAPGTRITWCYLTDPEGNIIELQSTART